MDPKPYTLNPQPFMLDPKQGLELPMDPQIFQLKVQDSRSGPKLG